MGRSGNRPSGAGRHITWYSTGKSRWSTSSALYLKTLKQLSTRMRGATMEVTTCRPSGAQAQPTVMGTRTLPINLHLPSAFLSKNSMSPGRLPKPPSMMKRPCGLHRTTLRGPAFWGQSVEEFLSPRHEGG